jgi:hypothetical protein
LSTERFTRALEADAEDMDGADVVSVDSPETTPTAQLSKKLRSGGDDKQKSLPEPDQQENQPHPTLTPSGPPDGKPATKKKPDDEKPTMPPAVADADLKPAPEKAAPSELMEKLADNTPPTTDSAPAVEETWNAFVDRIIELAYDANDKLPSPLTPSEMEEKMSTALAACIKRLKKNSGDECDAADRQRIVEALTAARGYFAFLAPPQNDEKPQPAETKADEVAKPEEKKTDASGTWSWPDFIGIVAGIAVKKELLKTDDDRAAFIASSTAAKANPADPKNISEYAAAMRMMRIRNKWNGDSPATAKLIASKAAQELMTAATDSMIADKWDWVKGKAL